MKQLAYVLFGWAFTVIASWCSGKLLLRSIPVRLYQQEENLFAFIVGSACMSSAVFLLTALHLSYKGVILAVALLPVAIAIHRRVWQPRGDSLPDLLPVWRLLFLEIYLPFAVIYLIYALAPESSPDGSTYHLGLVARYAREHGFPAITTNMYASLSQGLEMLFLSAFLFGRHSAAALVHCTYLLVLPLIILNYGKRIGMPSAGVAGGLLIFLSPIAGLSGTSAYNDVAVTTVAFSLFALLQIWAGQRDSALLIPIGLLAGFAFDIKYTAFIAVPYALAFVAYKRRRSREPILRPVLAVAAAAAVLILPTLVKNSIVVHNPVAPFFNRLFPNPYVHVSFEEAYRRQMRTTQYPLQSGWEIPWEATVSGGKLQGLLGPVFLLAPLALLALRYSAGRQLLLAALVFGLSYPANVGTRFLLPCVVFLAPALAISVSAWPVVPMLLVLLHAFLSWPSNLKLYCEEHASSLGDVPVRAALRLESEDEYLTRRLSGYPLARRIEAETPPGSRIFSFDNPPEAYCRREILVSFQAALNERLGQTLYAGFDTDFQPTRALTFHIPPKRLRRLRVVQTASGRPDIPGINEIEIFGAQGLLTRQAGWRVNAHPFPWDAELAFDHNQATQWKAWQAMAAGMFVEVDFGQEEAITEVRLDIPADQGYMRWQLEGEQSPGRWSVLSANAVLSLVKENMDLRKEAAGQLKQNGIRYIVVPDSDLAASDFHNNTPQWGVHLVCEVAGSNLYQVE